MSTGIAHTYMHISPPHTHAIQSFKNFQAVEPSTNLDPVIKPPLTMLIIVCAELLSEDHIRGNPVTTIPVFIYFLWERCLNHQLPEELPKVGSHINLNEIIQKTIFL